MPDLIRHPESLGNLDSGLRRNDDTGSNRHFRMGTSLATKYTLARHSAAYSAEVDRLRRLDQRAGTNNTKGYEAEKTEVRDQQKAEGEKASQPPNRKCGHKSFHFSFPISVWERL